MSSSSSSSGGLSWGAIVGLAILIAVVVYGMDHGWFSSQGPRYGRDSFTSQRYNAPAPPMQVGSQCRMVAPYEGEMGYVWGDGRCHHLPPNYDRGAQVQPMAPPSYALASARAQAAPSDLSPVAHNPGRMCTMNGSHAGERGYAWGDGRCHHLPPR